MTAPIKLICHRRRQIYIRGYWDKDSQQHPLTRNATKGQAGGGGQNYTFCPIWTKNRDVSKYDIYFLAATKQLYEWFGSSVRAWVVCELRRHWVTIRYKFARKHPCHNWLFNSLTSCGGNCYQTETANQWVCGTGSWWVALTLRYSQLVHSTLLNDSE